ncbi:thiamine diphosphate-binding protein [Fimicolochytrium jonesii]|uniref:thiamine diphosphate-binding protein n=1 Tax=Fimicolochytrium jonesii TaxID=1396493 RepID=UPI0022FE66CE|nr:thiamine diphosphate-binding protein [Fimicolochytrium jonesii]KAI8818414.1 thiamine diphosphate-binding protein [Fimicolochytrium jonesii]
MTVREALDQAMEEGMRKGKRVFLLGEDVGLLNKFGPQRVVDTPITEAGFAGLAVGAATARLEPVCGFMTFNFAMQASSFSFPIVCGGPNAAAAGVGAQHSQEVVAWYGRIPGLKVRRFTDPVLVLGNELMYGVLFDVSDDVVKDNFVLPIGKAKVEHSRAVGQSLKVAQELERHGIEVEVPDIINLRSIRALDIDTIIKPPVNRVTGADVPTPYAKNLEYLTFPRPEVIRNPILKTLNQK